MVINMEETSKKSSKLVWLVILVVVIVLVVLWQTGKLGASGSSNDYQAVFLSNNQVYFGRLTSENSQYPMLKEVYYLQVTQTLQPRDESEPAPPNINLVKLGGEIHGPTDEMRINRDHILFVEDLKADSQVVTAIKSFKESQAQ